jgi:glycosyltransferase involved in cell wall biosynthesis
MSVFNDRPFVAAAVESILRQTFEDFEFVVMDNASTDGTAEVLASFRDPRIRIYRNETTLGLPASLQKGLQRVAGRYVARMDGDDISLPGRLASQVRFLEDHPRTGIVGTACVVTDYLGGRTGIVIQPRTDLEIRWVMLHRCPFVHSSVMMRRDVLEQNHLTYDDRYPVAEDYWLWTRLLKVTRGANLATPFLHLRVRDGISVTNSKRQLANKQEIALGALASEFPGVVFGEEDLATFEQLFAPPERQAELSSRCYLQALARYYGLVDRFRGKYAGHEDSRRLERLAAAEMAGSLITHLGLMRCGSLLARLLVRETRLAGFLCKHFPFLVMRRVFASAKHQLAALCDEGLGVRRLSRWIKRWALPLR